MESKDDALPAPVEQDTVTLSLDDALPAPIEQQTVEVSFGRKFAASSIGNILEWYDFAVFGGLADVIGEKFFPASSRVGSFLEALAVFGAAFVMRPIGGLIFGWLGDVWGRKLALELSIFVMLVPSLCIGFLPGYASIGATATGLLCILRLLQGIAVGGELVTAYVFVAEHAPSARTAPAWTGLVLDSANCGTLLGIGAVATVRALLSRKQLYRFGWRLCFWFGFPLGAAGLLLRRGIGDTPEFVGAKENPLWVVWATRRLEVLLVAGVSSLWCGGFYTCFVWMPFFYKETNVQGAFFVNAVMLVVLVVLFVPAALSTRPECGSKPDSNAKRALRRGQYLMFFIAVPGFLCLAHSRSAFAAVIVQFLFGCSLASFGAGMPFFLVHAFAVDVRVAAIGLAYNIAQALFGGTAPLLQTALVRIHPVLPGVVLSLLAVFSHVSLAVFDGLSPSLVPDDDGKAHVELATLTTHDDDSTLC